MRLLIFTLLLSFLSLSSLFASEREWNVGSDEFNSLGTISATTTVNGLTIYADESHTVVVEANSKTLDGVDYTTRMKLGGAGSLTAGAEYRALAIDVTGNTTISVAAISSSSSADREMVLLGGEGDTISTQPVLGASIGWAVFEYVGGAKTLYLASKASGINVYYIKAVSEEVTSNVKEIVFVKNTNNNNDSTVIAAIDAMPEYNVTVIAQDVVTDSLLDIFNAADVVIIGRAINSSNVGSGMAVWDKITKPVLCTNMWGMRGMAGKAYWTPSASCANMKNADSVYIQATILKAKDPVFDGVSGTIDWWAGNYSVFGVDAEGDDAGNGELLAETPDKRPLFMRWAAGTEFYPGAGHTPMGDRTYIGCGSDDGGVINYFAYSDQAKTIFFAELARMASGEPLVIKKPMKSTDEYAIFDPAVVDPDDLVDGMSIVELDGKKYLQVVVDEWNSILAVPEFKFEPGMTAFAEFKYKVGQTEFPAEKINAAVQLIDTINKMTVSWSTTPVSSTTGIVQSNPSGEFVKSSAACVATMKVVHQVQFFGQQTVSWGAVKGDTLWVGKVRAYKTDETTIFDPATYDPDNYAPGMSLVDVNGKKYLKVAVDGWNSIVDVPEFKLKEGVKAYTEFKYVVGQTEFTADKINATVQLIDTINKMTVSWSSTPVSSTTGLTQSNPSGEFKETSAAITATMKVVHQVQFFGQQTVSWGAVAGDTMWVGAVTAKTVTPPDPNVILDPATYTGAMGPGFSIVTIDGTKYFKVALDSWNTYMAFPDYTFPAGKNAFKAAVKYEAGTSGAVLDGLGAFLKFSTSGWAEIGAGRTAVGTTFADQVVTLAANEGNVAGVFQVAVQDANNGYNPVSGDYLYIGKIMAVTTAPITFVVDDSKYMKYDGFSVRGSWLTNSGIFDSGWNGGVNHFELTDSVGDVADNIWEHTVNLVADGGTNTWHWGFLDLSDNWLVTGADPAFTVTDWTPQTITYTIGGTGVDGLLMELKVFPNPVNNVLNVSGRNVESISVYNLSGAKMLVSQKSGNSIDVSGLSNGTYIVKVTDINGETAIRKFSKK